jgi:hypothetical protein
MERTSDADPKSGVLESIMVIERVAEIEKSSLPWSVFMVGCEKRALVGKKKMRHVNRKMGRNYAPLCTHVQTKAKAATVCHWKPALKRTSRAVVKLDVLDKKMLPSNATATST